MAKKDLSGAAGLDGLFTRGKTTATEAPKAKPKSKPATVKPKEEAAISQAKVLEIVSEEIPETVSAPKPVKNERKSKAPKAKSEPSHKSQSSSSKSTFTVDISNVRKEEIKYTGIRLKQDLFKRLEAIKDAEKLKSTNSLISTILEAYCDGYESA